MARSTRLPARRCQGPVITAPRAWSSTRRTRAVHRPATSPPPTKQVQRWAYRTYDCVEADESPELGGVDLLVAAGLNGQLQARTVASLLAVAPEVSKALRSLAPIGREPCFWTMARDDLAAVPPGTSDAWPVWRAWSLFIGAPHVGIAVTHKTLHHKRPDIFPLLDRRRIKAFRSHKSAWAEIHQDLTKNPDGWTYVEDCFAMEASRRDARPLRSSWRIRRADREPVRLSRGSVNRVIRPITGG